MPGLETILAKSYEETTMADAIVLFFAGNEEEKKEALKRITFLQDKDKSKNEVMAEAIVSFLSEDDEKHKEAALERIEILHRADHKKQSKAAKTFKLSIAKE